MPILATVPITRSENACCVLNTEQQCKEFSEIFSALTEQYETCWKDRDAYELGVWCSRVAAAIVTRDQRKAKYRYCKPVWRWRQEVLRARREL